MAHDADRRTIAVTGASGNLGTALLHRLGADERVGEIRAIARRPPVRDDGPQVRWSAADIVADDLAPIFEGADVVIHLAWRIQPSWDLAAMRAVNVTGSSRTFEAAAAAGAAIVHASSIGAYGPGPKDRAVDERWPVTGHPNHPYSVQKVEVERLLDGIEARHPELRVVRMRPSLVLQSAAGRELRRYFLPRHLPGALLRPALLERAPVRVQLVHADDAADAFARAALGEARGAFNVATTDPVGGSPRAGLELVARPLASLSWRLHLQPVDPGWVTTLVRSPLIDPGRAHAELGWRPRRSGAEVLAEGLAAMADPPAPPTPALRGATG